MTPADVITALLCHPLIGLFFSFLHMDFSDRYIKPWQLHLLTANPPLTQMHVHTKTLRPTPCDHLTQPSQGFIYNLLGLLVFKSDQCSVCCLSEWGSEECLRTQRRAAAATVGLVKIQTRKTQKAKEPRDSPGYNCLAGSCGRWLQRIPRGLSCETLEKTTTMFFRIPRLTPGYIRYLQVRKTLKADFFSL